MGRPDQAYVVEPVVGSFETLGGLNAPLEKCIHWHGWLRPPQPRGVHDRWSQTHSHSSLPSWRI